MPHQVLSLQRKSQETFEVFGLPPTGKLNSPIPRPSRLQHLQEHTREVMSADNFETLAGKGSHTFVHVGTNRSDILSRRPVQAPPDQGSRIPSQGDLANIH